MNKVFFSFLILIFSGCQDSSIERPLFVNDFFPNPGFKSFSLTIDDVQSDSLLFIDDVFVEKLSFKEVLVYDSIQIKIPTTYLSLNDGSLDRIYVFNGIDSTRLNFQILVNQSGDSFDLFNEVYQHAFRSGMNFNLKSCEFFQTEESNFLVYELQLEDKYALGFIFTKNGSRYFESSYIAKRPINGREKILFSNMLCSIRIKNNKLIPLFKEIIKTESVEIKN